MVMRLDSPQPIFTFPDLKFIPDEVEDQPAAGIALNQISNLHLPKLVFGAGSLSNQYNTDATLTSNTPLRTIRLALRYGINAFDTSAYYGPSEIILGAALKALEKEFPRSSYKIMTKCGRYGLTKEAFDYSPATIRHSVERSLSRLHTDYLDVVYLHDVEFVAANVMPQATGNAESALTTNAFEYGLAEGMEGIIHEGDRQVLHAYGELRKMKQEGLVRQIGITGLPLPTLLRLSILIKHTFHEPVDSLLSYSHSNLQNNNFHTFVPHFRKRAGIQQLLSASPLNMGLLTPSPPPWHPATPELKAVTKQVLGLSENWPGGLPNIALGYSMREAAANGLPTVVGLSSPKEVHEAVRVWREVAGRYEIEQAVIELYEQSGTLGWSWASP